ncbi:MAG: hypothetical protein JNL74_17355 [Fibrobacteres bacterium]|nr:hypothetical protein [Fibrobacterota bacterium]
MKRMLIIAFLLSASTIFAVTHVWVTYPNGGETFRVGDTITVKWDSDTSVHENYIRITLDGGTNVFNICGQHQLIREGYQGTWGEFKWVIPAYQVISIEDNSPEGSHDSIVTFVSNKCLIKIDNPYNNDQAGDSYDYSNATFTILPSLGNVKATSRESAKTFFGSDSSKLIFKSSFDNYLYFVNFSDVTPEPFKLLATKGAVLPSVSPDGNWLTYATGVAGDDASGPSKAWILRLDGNIENTPVLIDSPAHEPRFFEDATGLYVTYSTKGGPNVYDSTSAKTKKRKVVNGNPVDSARTLVTNAGYVGGLSKDGNYLASGTLRAWMMNLTSKVKTQLHKLTVTRAGTVDSVITPQICNTSISQSVRYPDHMMYRDIGFTTSGYTHPIIGPTWEADKFIFISSSDNKLKRVYRIPLTKASNPVGGLVNTVQWDDMEWSTHPYFGVSGLFLRRCYASCITSGEQTSRHERIYGINLKDSVYLQLVGITDTAKTSSLDLVWPTLWVKKASTLAETTWLEKVIPVEEYNGKTTESIRFISAMQTIQSPIAIKTVSLFDISGRVVIKSNVNSVLRYTFNRDLTKTLAGGNYIVRVETVDGKMASMPWTIVK